MSKKSFKKDNYKYGFSDDNTPVYQSAKGLNEAVIRDISSRKFEDSWMLSQRLEAYEVFKQKEMPTWGADLSEINFDNLTYYLKPSDKVFENWDDVPEEIKYTYERLGVPQAEREYLAGVKAQYDSEVFYGSLIESLKKQGVIFLSMDEGLKNHYDLVKEYFGTVIPSSDNKFAALNTAVWSGGSFLYVPKGVKVNMPLQAYFRINAANMGQFERTLIIADEGSEVHYIEGCTAPQYTTDSLHSAVVEIIVKKNAKVRYTTIQNWSSNVYNLVTKRAHVYENAQMSWVDCNLGSKVTMKYPACHLLGEGAYGEVLSLAVASGIQHQDTGAKMLHLAPNTSSLVTSKSISDDQGRATYRGLVFVSPKAHGSKVKVECDALLLTPESRTDTYPKMKIHNKNVTVEHEASVSKLSEEKLYYLMSRGLSEERARLMLVNGFIEPIAKELPFEYAIELNRLIELEMEGSVG